MRETVVNLWEAGPVTISSGAALSGGVNLGGLRVFGVTMPTVWTAANLTFQTSTDGGTTWSNLYDINGNEIVATASAGRTIVLDPTLFAGVQLIQVRSGTSSTPVPQAQNSTLTLILRLI